MLAKNTILRKPSEKEERRRKEGEGREKYPVQTSTRTQPLWVSELLLFACKTRMKIQAKMGINVQIEK